jgi:hypothetical protein
MVTATPASHHLIQENENLRKKAHILELENKVLRDDLTALRAKSVRFAVETKEMLEKLREAINTP